MILVSILRLYAIWQLLLSLSTSTFAFVISPISLISSTTSSTSLSSLSATKKDIPCNEGTIEVTRQLNDTEHSYNIAYKLYRPMSLSSRQGAPIVVLHGGPSVPHNYLLPLVEVIPYRSILFYDQLGCGNSDEPTDLQAYSIENAINDLEVVLKKLGVRKYHLYGQSFGGILAYEFLKRKSQAGIEKSTTEGCQSVVLSSTPTCVTQVEDEAQRLILEELNGNSTLFSITYQCRVGDIDSYPPPPLAEAYSKAGTIWRGTNAIPNYKATKVDESVDEAPTRMPSTLILNGEYDFVTNECIKDWESIINTPFVRYKMLENCSHHGLLENPQLYGEIIDSYFSEYD